jgi:hypothetical protein
MDAFSISELRPVEVGVGNRVSNLVFVLSCSDRLWSVLHSKQVGKLFISEVTKVIHTHSVGFSFLVVLINGLKVLLKDSPSQLVFFIVCV